MRTPSFIRWCIQASCDMRIDLDEDAAPDAVERQLRSMRAIALARAQGRCLEGIAFQKRATSVGTDASSTLAVKIDEVFAPFGGESSVSNTCSDCFANAQCQLPTTGQVADDRSIEAESPIAGDSDGPASIAGCFGWLAIPDLEAWCRWLPWQDWCNLWQQPVFSGERLRLLAQQLELIRSRCDDRRMNLYHQLGQNGETFDDELCRFLDAIRRCESNQGVLCGEWIPVGIIESQKWRIPSHCSFCKHWCGTTPTPQKCERCGRIGKPEPARVRRTRGNRPFWELGRFLGEEAANQLLQRYRSLGTESLHENDRSNECS